MNLLDRASILDERAQNLMYAAKTAATQTAYYAAIVTDGDAFDERCAADRRDKWARRYSRLKDLENECRERSDALWDRFEDL